MFSASESGGEMDRKKKSRLILLPHLHVTFFVHVGEICTEEQTHRKTALSA